MPQSTICQLLLLVLILPLPDPTTAQGLTIFWYVDTSDIIPGKSPDIKITPGSTYGTIDKPTSSGEPKDAEKALDVIRGSAVPTGSDINRSVWDPSLEDLVVKSAVRCDGGSGGTLGTAGEIVVASTTRLSFKDALTLAKFDGRHYDHAQNKCNKPEYPGCEQYRLLMSASVTGFACARAHCPDTAMPYRVHCALSPKPTGASATGTPYQHGTPCQLCPRERGYCYNNLCVSHDEKTKILKEIPNAKVTCSAPCMNCGERKDVANTCSCHCPAGYTTAVDCSVAGAGANPSALKCGACARIGKPCLNGGIDPYDDATCTTSFCLCPKKFKGPSCEIPDNGFTGGVNVPLAGPDVCVGAACGKASPDLNDITKILEDLKPTLSNEINNFCKKSQQNYILCCGVGTLPTSGPVDFVSAADVKNLEQVKYDADGKLVVPIFVTVKGNNGLCRKTTQDPTPIVPIPPEVLIKVITDKLPTFKAPCCQASVSTPTGSVADVIKGGQRIDIAYLAVSLK